MQDEIKLCTTWLFYFARPAKHYASRSCEELAERVSRWAGVYVRPEAFIIGASHLGFEGKEEHGRHYIKASVTA